LNLRDADWIAHSILDYDNIARDGLAIVAKADVRLFKRVNLQPSLLHERPSKDDGEVAVFDKHDLELYGLFSDLDRPRSEICNTAETIEAWCGVLGNKTVLEGKLAGHVAVTVTFFHHHSDIFNRSNGTDEGPDTKLVVELVESELVDRYTGHQSLLLECLCGLVGPNASPTDSSGISTVRLVGSIAAGDKVNGSGFRSWAARCARVQALAIV